MTKYAFYILLFLFLNPFELVGFHIIGGELTYECIGANQYEFSLKIYRDCGGEGAEYDDPAFLHIFNQNGTLLDILEAGFTFANPLEPNADICIETLPDVCVEETTYTYIYTRPAGVEGPLDFVYQRYSRNGTIINIINPAETGSTYMVTLPDENSFPCNNSPYFNNFPPIVICQGSPIIFDHSATDIDGDYLVYSLCDPLIGGGEFCYQPGGEFCDPPFAPAPPPPYPAVDWGAGYSDIYPINTDPAISIDPETGLLTGTPLDLGQHVVGICVTEYIGGQAVSTVKRDFQFNITDCLTINALIESDDIGPNGEFIIYNCNSFEVSFSNNTIGADTHQWDFGDPSTTTDNSNLYEPTYLYPDTGLYVVNYIANPNVSCTDQATIWLYLYPLLEADFETIQPNICAEEIINFGDLSNSDYSDIVDWEWDFGDNGLSTEQNPSHIYYEGGTYDVSLVTTNEIGCVDSIQLPLYIADIPTALFDLSLLCLDVPVNFSDLSEGNIVGFEWDFGDSFADPADNSSVFPNPSHTYSQVGDYTITYSVVTDEGCENETTLDFTIYPEIFAEAGPDTETCFGDGVQVFSSSTGGAGSDNTYLWEPSDLFPDPTLAIPTVFPTQDTTLTVTVFDPNGCSSEDQLFLVVHPLPLLTADNDVTICYGDSTQLGAMIPNDGIIDFGWEPASTLSDASLIDPIAFPLETTDYIIAITDTNSCINRDTLTVTVVPLVDADAGPDLTICDGDEVELQASGGAQFAWTPSYGLSDPTIANPIANPSEDTEYIVRVYNECFEDFDTLFITVNPTPFVDAGTSVTINIGEEHTIDGFADGNVFWTPETGLSNPNIPNPVVQLIEPQTFYLNAENEFGCTAIDSVTIDLTYFIEAVLPNAFSPNGDGLNDIFRFNMRGIKEVRAFRIYNRWGQKIFEGFSPEDGWDGTYKGELQDMGVYVYYVDMVSFLDEHLVEKGNVTLVR